MTVGELLEKLKGVDPELEVGHLIPDMTGYVSRVSSVCLAEAGGGKALALCTDSRDGCLFYDEGADELREADLTPL